MAALKAAAMCNDAGFGPDGKLLGDPMETALLHAVRAVGLDIEELKSQEPRLRERLRSEAVGRKRREAGPGNVIRLTMNQSDYFESIFYSIIKFLFCVTYTIISS